MQDGRVPKIRLQTDMMHRVLLFLSLHYEHATEILFKISDVSRLALILWKLTYNAVSSYLPL